jgi:AcrR family transcriptional regulator
MHSEKVDRRVKYTKLALRESAINLLQRKPIEKISVKELCEAADINRSTFYAHYDSPADLLEQIERELLRDLNAYLDGYNFKEYEEESFKKIVMIFEYVAENAELCKVLLGETGNMKLQREIMTLVQYHGLRDWQGAAEDEEAVEYMLSFGVSGGIGLLQKWLRGGLTRSAREVAEMVIKFTYRGLSAFGGNLE